MEANHWGELVVIDIHRGDYEVGEYKGPRSDPELTKRRQERWPDAFAWAELAGKEQYISAGVGGVTVGRLAARIIILRKSAWELSVLR